MHYLDPIVLILGGILASAGLIVAKNPNAKEMIAKLQPYQALIGIALLVVGIYDLIQTVFGMHVLDGLSKAPLFCGTILACVFGSILLGILFGMPMLAKLSPEAAAKGDELGKKLAPYQTLIGLVGIAAGFLAILFWSGMIRQNM